MKAWRPPEQEPKMPRIVGWCVADRESATVFTALFNDATAKHPAPPGQLTLHADRGGLMRAKATALLLADLGVTKSHSRPHTSNDNPFSESPYGSKQMRCCLSRVCERLIRSSADD